VAGICVPQRPPCLTLQTGWAGQIPVTCQRPVWPADECREVPCQGHSPTVDEIAARSGLSSLFGLLGAAGANPDSVIWDFYDLFTGPGGRNAFGFFFRHDPGVDDYGGGGCSKRAVGWLVGQLDSAYNAGVGPGGFSALGVAGIQGEADAAARGEKSSRERDRTDPDSPFEGPGIGWYDWGFEDPDWVPCSDPGGKVTAWGEPGGGAWDSLGDRGVLPRPLTDLPAFRLVAGAGYGSFSGGSEGGSVSF
jgi:hypothetical protein